MLDPLIFESKLIKYVVGVAAIAVMVSLSYMNGYSTGKTQEKTKYELLQAEAIKAALTRQQAQLQANYDAQLVIEQNKKKTTTIYREKKKKLEDLKAQPHECNLSQEKADKLNEIVNGRKE
jgi:hypothetical protein